MIDTLIAILKATGGTVRTIAVLGARTSDDADTLELIKLLSLHGYRLYAVKEAESEKTIAERPVYDTLRNIPVSVHMIIVDRLQGFAQPVIEDAIAMKVTVIWFAHGVPETEMRYLRDAVAAGINVFLKDGTRA